jgi:hypothetical protein
VDSSIIVAGMILAQIDDEEKQRPAQYGSIPMDERESRYSQPTLELYVLSHMPCSWCIYVIGVKTLHVEV